MAHLTGSEVVRDEFIGGLENTDQVVFLISVVAGAWGVGRGRHGGGGVRRGRAVRAASEAVWRGSVERQAGGR